MKFLLPVEVIDRGRIQDSEIHIPVEGSIPLDKAVQEAACPGDGIQVTWIDLAKNSQEDLTGEVKEACHSQTTLGRSIWCVCMQGVGGRLLSDQRRENILNLCPFRATNDNFPSLLATICGVLSHACSLYAQRIGL